MQGHDQPTEHSNSCGYCVSVFGVKCRIKYKNKRRPYGARRKNKGSKKRT